LNLLENPLQECLANSGLAELPRQHRLAALHNNLHNDFLPVRRTFSMLTSAEMLHAWILNMYRRGGHHIHQAGYA